MADYVLSAKGTYDGSSFDKGIEESQSKLSSFMEKAKSIGDKVGSFAKGVATFAGGVGGAIGQMAATGGFARALNIEKAQTMFKGLKLEWKDYEKTINKAVDGTAYSFDAAALVAANLAASGVSAGQNMDDALRGAVGTASTFGAELGDIGSLYSKVAAQGKLNGEIVQQFADRGINVTATLAKQLGKTEAQVKEMVKSGKVDFKTFSDAMNAAFGDSSAAANETFTGSMANMKAALSRIGAKFADPIRANAIPVFNAFRLALNSVSERLDPLVQKFSDLVGKISGGLTDKIGAFTEALKNGGSVMEALDAAFGPVLSKVAIFIGAFGGIGVVAGALSSVLSAIPGLGAIAGILSGGATSAGVFSVALKGLSGAFTGFAKAMTAAGGGMGGFKVAFAALATPLNIALVAIVALAAAFIYLMSANEEFRNTIMNLVGSIQASLAPVMQQLANTVLPAIMSLIQAIMPLIAAVITVIAQIAAALAPIIATIISVLLPIMTQIINVIVLIVQQIVAFLVPIINQIVAFISANMPVIQGVIEGVMNAIKAVVDAVWPVIQAIIEIAMNAIQTVISVVSAIIAGDWSGAWDAISSFLSGTWETMKGIVQGGIDAVLGFIQGIPDAILGFFSGAGDLLIDAGKSIIDGLLNGLKGAFDGVKDFVGGIGSWIAEHKGPKEYDLKLLVPNGGWIMQSLQRGLAIGSKGVMRTVSGIAGQVQSTFADSLDINPRAYVNPNASIVSFPGANVEFGGSGNTPGSQSVQQNFNIYANDPDQVCAMVASRQRRAMAI